MILLACLGKWTSMCFELFFNFCSHESRFCQHTGFFLFLFQCYVLSSRVICFCFQELSLVGLGFSAIPPEVWESGEVTKLDLSKNSIEELPVELSSCSSLEVYHLVFLHKMKTLRKRTEEYLLVCWIA